MDAARGVEWVANSPACGSKHRALSAEGGRKAMRSLFRLLADTAGVLAVSHYTRRWKKGNIMRRFYDGGNRKSKKYCVCVDAQSDSRKSACELYLELYWWDSFLHKGMSIKREFTIARRRTVDAVYAELLAMFDEAGFFPKESEQDDLHALLTVEIENNVKRL